MYLAVVCDRHTDPEYRMSENKSKAVAWARDRFKEVVAYPEEIKENEIKGLYYQATYLEDGDHAYVTTVESLDVPDLVSREGSNAWDQTGG